MRENLEWYYSPAALWLYPGFIEWQRENGKALTGESERFIAAWALLGVTV